MQSKKRSLIESIANVVVGFGVSCASVHFIFPLFGHEVSLGDNCLIGIYFTFISIIRSYTLRRIFNHKDDNGK